MAKVVFKSYNQNDNLPFPPCLGDFIADNDPVRVLNTIVDNLDKAVSMEASSASIIAATGWSGQSSLYLPLLTT